MPKEKISSISGLSSDCFPRRRDTRGCFDVRGIAAHLLVATWLRPLRPRPKKKYCCASGFVAFLCLPVVVPRYGLFLLPCIFSLTLYCKLFGVSGSVSKKTITNKQNHLSWNHAIDSCWRSDDLLTKKHPKKHAHTKILSLEMLAVSLQEYCLYDPYRFGTGGPPPNVTHFVKNPYNQHLQKCKLHLG